MTTTSQMVFNLKENKQDFEWYPTTKTMVEVIKRYIPKNTDSIMDIGAGDGRVLRWLSEHCEFVKLYGIEVSQILIQAQPENVIPVGTNLHEQNLSTLEVDYIFSNPPYSEFEEWVYKIIEQGYAKKAFLVIPQRWSDSKVIKEALKKRGASARVIHSDDFLNGERQARAIIDIVEISFPRSSYHDKPADPFDIWFDDNVDTFDKEKEVEEDVSGSNLARKFSHSSIDEMVEAYLDEYGRLESNYKAIFKLDYAILKELNIDKNIVRDGLKKKMSGLKVKYWNILFDRLDAITSRLSTDSKQKLIEKLTRNTKVDFTVQNAYSVVIWAIKNANQYFDEQLVELFFDLSSFEGVHNYKSNIKTWVKHSWRYGNADRENTHYKLDYRIVVSRHSAIYKDDGGFGIRRWDYPNDLAKTCHELIADVIAVMNNLGFVTVSDSSYNRGDWISGQWEDFETSTGEILFQVKAHKNGNLHFRFMPDAIMALNINAGRLLKWVESEDEVVSEMGYTHEQAKQYFNGNIKITANNVMLLSSGSEPLF